MTFYLQNVLTKPKTNEQLLFSFLKKISILVNKNNKIFGIFF